MSRVNSGMLSKARREGEEKGEGAARERGQRLVSVLASASATTATAMAKAAAATAAAKWKL